jgi:PleD family two-component response regulator
LSRSDNSILLIDPYKNLLEAFQLLFKQLEFTVDAARTLTEAQGLLSENNYSIILSEFLFPLETCLNFWQETKNKNPETFLTVVTDVVMTDELYQKLFEFGADDLIRKPVSPERLLVHIRRGLHYRELQINREQMEQLALMDPISMAAKKIILSSGYFRKCLRAELKKARRHQEPISLLLVKPSAKENINNKMGDFIAEVAKILGQNTREEDLIGKENGAFGLILYRTDQTGSRVLEDRLNRLIQDHPTFQGEFFQGLLKNIIFESFTYPNQTEMPEPFTEILTEVIRDNPLH